MALVSLFLLLLAVHRSASLSIACLVSPGSLTNPCPAPPPTVSWSPACVAVRCASGLTCSLRTYRCATGLTCVFPPCASGLTCSLRTYRCATGLTCVFPPCASGLTCVFPPYVQVCYRPDVCATGLTCVFPTCEETVQEYVQPDGTVLQAISPCLWTWRPGTCQTRSA
ncbi:hypothetical protein Bbelb_438930 [Branchiostoma belcheri]|nr:hypothetical protein Bbelb_438930 [Branchiostoma belcheri]